MEVPTPLGGAQVDLDDMPDPLFLLVLTHSSNGGVNAPDLLAVRAAARDLGNGVVARVTQPFRRAGRRAPGPPDRQDEAWLAVIDALKARYPGVILIQGGRSNGARVACRTAARAGARGVIALAFPLIPPGRPGRPNKPDKPDKSRRAELQNAGTEVLVINGDRDPFGVPDENDATHVEVMPGNGHDLRRNPAAVQEIAAEWLRRWSSELNPPRKIIKKD